MKTLANCNPKEFLRQTNRIRRSAENWLKLTDIMEIRKRKPDIPSDATKEETRAAYRAQMAKNANAMLDAMLEEHLDETVELLGLVCFVEPHDLENHSMTEFLSAFNEIIGNQEVLDFFISLARLAGMNISDAAKV